MGRERRGEGGGPGRTSPTTANPKRQACAVLPGAPRVPQGVITPTDCVTDEGRARGTRRPSPPVPRSGFGSKRRPASGPVLRHDRAALRAFGFPDGDFRALCACSDELPWDQRGQRQSSALTATELTNSPNRDCGVWKNGGNGVIGKTWGGGGDVGRGLAQGLGI